MANNLGDKPNKAAVRRVMWFGLASLLAPLLGVANGIFRRFFDPVSVNDGGIRIPMGLSGVVLALMFSITAIAIGARAYKQGERSWVLWVGFVPAVLVALFWTFMIVGELLFPY